jgi:hypothetical protein
METFFDRFGITEKPLAAVHFSGFQEAGSSFDVHWRFGSRHLLQADEPVPRILRAFERAYGYPRLVDFQEGERASQRTGVRLRLKCRQWLVEAGRLPGCLAFGPVAAMGVERVGEVVLSEILGRLMPKAPEGPG